MASPVGTEAILQAMADAIPAHPQGDTGSDLSASYEVVALLAHAYMTVLGFRLLGFNEDKRIEETCKNLSPRLPPEWNASFGSHRFVYAHKQSAMTFVIIVDRIGSKVEIRGLAVGDENIYRIEKSVRDIVKSSGLPVRITLSRDGLEDRSDLVSKLRDVFVSTEALQDIITQLRVSIVQKLIPKLQREGYEETEEARTANQPSDQPRPPYEPAPNVPDPRNFPDPLGGPLHQPRRPPVPAGDFPPPDFEDEYEINRPPRGGIPFGQPGQPPFNIGHDDLNPPGLGPHDPLRASFVGGGLPRPGGGAGMHPTFDDPLFGGHYEGGGGRLFDPQAPPGARWDPLGPGGRPRRGGGPGNPFGGGFGGDII